VFDCFACSLHFGCVSCTCQEGIWGKEVYLHPFLTLLLDRGGWSASHPSLRYTKLLDGCTAQQSVHLGEDTSLASAVNQTTIPSSSSL
jgi:hypothetical protein